MYIKPVSRQRNLSTKTTDILKNKQQNALGNTRKNAKENPEKGHQ